MAVIKISELPQVLSLGNQSEQGKSIQFDVSEWNALYPSARYEITYIRPGETGSWPATGVTHSNGTLTWVVSRSVTLKAGQGSFVIHCYVDEDEKNTGEAWYFIGGGHEIGETPDAVAEWLAETNAAESLRETAETARETTEGLRDTAEGLRAGAETSRNTAEGLRDSAETSRREAEVLRVAAEATRMGFKPMGAYNPANENKYGEWYTHEGGSYGYIYPTPSTGVPLTDTSHWQQIASVGGQDILDAVTAEKNAAIAAKVLAEGYAAQLAAGTASPADTYADLAALIAANPDHSKIYLTLDDGNWCYWNGAAFVAGGVYQAASVAADVAALNSLFDDVLTTANILPPDQESGWYHTGTGEPREGVTYIRTPSKIQITPGLTKIYCHTNVIASGTLFIFYYDANNAFISASSFTNASYNAFNVPALATSITMAYSDVAYSFADVSISYSNVPYSAYTEVKQIKEININQALVDKVDAVYDKTSEIETVPATDNVLPPDTEFGRYDTTTGLPVITISYARTPSAIDPYTIMDGASKIYCVPKDIINEFITLLYYDADKAYISFSSFRNEASAVFNIPTGAKFFRVFIGSGSYDFADLCISFVSRATFIAYSAKSVILENNIDPILLGKVDGVLPLSGKTIVNFGDSIFGIYSAPNDISTELASVTGATVYNCGFGGCQMAEHAANWDAFSMYRLAYAVANDDFTLQDAAVANEDWTEMPAYFPARLNTLKSIDFSGVDIVTIAYGANDYTAGVVLDDAINITNTAKFGSALRYSIETLLTAFPNILVFVLTPIYRAWLNGTEFVEDSNTKLNINGATVIDFCDKCIVVANEYNLPSIDNYHIGIGKFTRSVYFDLPDNTHPNLAGCKLIARHMAHEMYC